MRRRRRSRGDDGVSVAGDARGKRPRRPRRRQGRRQGVCLGLTTAAAAGGRRRRGQAGSQGSDRRRTGRWRRLARANKQIQRVCTKIPNSEGSFQSVGYTRHNYIRGQRRARVYSYYRLYSLLKLGQGALSWGFLYLCHTDPLTRTSPTMWS